MLHGGCDKCHFYRSVWKKVSSMPDDSLKNLDLVPGGGSGLGRSERGTGSSPESQPRWKSKIMIDMLSETHAINRRFIKARIGGLVRFWTEGCENKCIRHNPWLHGSPTPFLVTPPSPHTPPGNCHTCLFTHAGARLELFSTAGICLPRSQL